MRSKFAKSLIIAVLNTCVLGIAISILNNDTSKNTNIVFEETINQKEVVMDAIKNEIIAEIDRYIYTVAPSSGVRGEVLFELCDAYGVDVRFAMAQAQVESHYATKGTAKKTNSIFNVGAYDGHSAKRQIRNGFGFNDPNDSIEPYLILVTSDYLVNGKTIYDLMNRYTNHLGMRYATNPRYEKMLRTVYNRINTNTELGDLLTQYNEYKG